MSFDADPPPVVSLMRLHIDTAGRLWYGDDQTPAAVSTMDAAAFFRQRAAGYGLPDVRTVRLLGGHGNAGLIRTLVKLRGKSLRFPQVLIGNHRVAEHCSWSGNAAVANLGVIITASERRHWRLLSPVDDATYQLVQDDDVNVLRRHPVWAACQFASLDLAHVMTIVKEVLDPRWFMHTTRPGRLTRLFSFFGLTRQNVSAYLVNGKSSHNYARAKAAIGAWYPNARAADVRPGSFLSRDMASRNDLVRGVLYGTERLLRLLMLLWTHHLSLHTEMRFLPDRYFGNPAEAMAFEEIWHPSC